MDRIPLSARLASVAALVPRGAVLADIGTDHGFLPIHLLRQGYIQRAIAADLRRGPLEKAVENGKRYGVTENLDFRLSDGLAEIKPHEVDTVVIAGMGGETIAGILAAAPWTREGGCRLILQPMTAHYDLRDFLNGSGYAILGEHLNEEGRHIYVTMEVTAGEEPPYTPGEKWAGRQFEGMDSPLRDVYLQMLETRVRRALVGLRQSVRPGDVPRRELLEQIASQLEEMRKEWQTWR